MCSSKVLEQLAEVEPESPPSTNVPLPMPEPETEDLGAEHLNESARPRSRFQPSTSTTLNKMAMVHHSQGNYDEALRLCDQRCPITMHVKSYIHILLQRE